MTDPVAQIDLRSPRTVGQILDLAFRLYAQRARLFLLLASIVLVPYGVVAALVTRASHVSTSAELVLTLVDLALVNPFVTAMQMQVLSDLGEARDPRIPGVLARGLRVLPVVAAADIIAFLAEFAGLLVFIVPGVLLAVRLAVVAPAAATGATTWPAALSRSFRLTRGNFWRVFGLLVIQAVLTYLALAIESQRAAFALVLGLALSILAQSFCTLLISLLYFDLRARDAASVA